MRNYCFIENKPIDITIPLHENMEKYPSLKGFRLKWIRKMGIDEKINMSEFSMETHVGTHVDAPLHFIEGGKSLEQMPIENLLGRAQVIEVPYPQTVTDEFLHREYRGFKIVLFKFGKQRYNREFDYFDQRGIDFLLKNGVKVIGTDNFTVDSQKTKYRIHVLILNHEVFIVEGLDLERVQPGIYIFVCLPLSIRLAEAAPARALLFPGEEETG